MALLPAAARKPVAYVRVALVFVYLIGAACSKASNPDASAPRTSEPSPTPVSYWKTPPPNGCSRQAVDDLVREFFPAFNSGDLRALDRIFAPDPEFRWYSDEQSVIKDRDELLPYFASERQAGTRYNLVRLRVSQERGWHGGFDFEYRFERTLPNSPSSFHVGKGAADCAIYVWSFGADEYAPGDFEEVTGAP